MSDEQKDLSEFFKANEPQKGVLQAIHEKVSDSLSAIFELAGKVWDEGKPMFDKGRSEVAAALFSGNDRGFVLYGNEAKQIDQPLHGPAAEAAPEVDPPEQQQTRGMAR